MIELDARQKVELIRYRHEDQCRLLYNISQTSLKVFSGFLTLQLAFGSFLTQIALTLGVKWGFILLELAICGICTVMLLNNQRRRREAAGTVKNCNIYLRFDEKGAYLPDRAINTKTKFWPWFPLYVAGIWLAFVGILFILFFGGTEHQTTPAPETSGNTRQETVVGKAALAAIADNHSCFFIK